MEVMGAIMLRSFGARIPRMFAKAAPVARGHNKNTWPASKEVAKTRRFPYGRDTKLTFGVSTKVIYPTSPL
jgi:hypothetical protein